MKACRTEIAALLLGHERSLVDPAVRRDRTRLAALLAEDFLEFGISGRMWSRDEIIEHLAAQEAYRPPAIENFACREIAPGVALVTYRTVRANATTGAIAATLRSSLWREVDGAWRLRFHQGTPVS